MSDNNSNYEEIVPASAVKWIGLVGGVLLPLFLAVVGAQIYFSGTSSQQVQVFPTPED